MKYAKEIWYTVLAIILVSVGVAANEYQPPFQPSFAPPKPPAEAYKYGLERTGPFEVAKVLGRSAGCQNADMDFIQLVSSTALHVGLDPRIAAATIAVESSCNQFAVSAKGAIGEMQVVPSVWKSEFDFGDVNLLNPRDNIETGTKILAGLIEQYGVDEGLHRYNGLGVGGDPAYTQKILVLSGRK